MYEVGRLDELLHEQSRGLVVRFNKLLHVIIPLGVELTNSLPLLLVWRVRLFFLEVELIVALEQEEYYFKKDVLDHLSAKIFVFNLEYLE